MSWKVFDRQRSASIRHARLVLALKARGVGISLQISFLAYCGASIF
ncbi:MAG: hypothetical protein ACLPX9_03915 [Rhodomicrobium sp.]